MIHEPTSADNMRGIIALMISQALFVASDSIVKLAGEVMPPSQIMAIRGLVAIALTLTIIYMSVSAQMWRSVLQGTVLLRAALEAGLAFLFLLAIRHITLGDITVIMQITPLVITVIAATALGETVGWRRWSAVTAGFLGVVLVAQPTGAGLNVYALVAVLVAVLVAIRDIITRRIDPTTPTPMVTLATTVSVCVLGFATAPFQAWQPLDQTGAAYLVASALLVTAANVFIIRAFRGVELSVVSPFRYFAVVWAIALGYAIWTDIPNTLAIIGTLLIVASGLYIMHRETIKLRTRS